MLKLPGINRSLLVFVVLGTIGLSTYGVYNTVSAFEDSRPSLSTGETGVNVVNSAGIKPDGTFCNPYGCAGCSGCVRLQYQQNVEETSESVADLQYEN